MATNPTWLLNELYKNASTHTVRIQSLEFYHPSMVEPIRIYNATSDTSLNMFLENTAPRNPGVNVLFEPSAFTLNDPGTSKEGHVSIDISFGPGVFKLLNSILDEILSSVNGFKDPFEVIYRVHVHDPNNLSIEPGCDPTVLYVESVAMDSSKGANITLSNTNTLLYRTGRLYNKTDFPGLELL